MLIGPFTQLLTMDGFPESGPLLDEQLQVIPRGGLRIEDGRIAEVGLFDEMRHHHSGEVIFEVDHKAVALPGWIDAHTHICYAGSRANDYALRVSGVTYQQIAAAGGGILDTVRYTREAGKEQLAALLRGRADAALARGVTTCEVKSGYGLTIDDEIKQLETIREVDSTHPLDLIPTCLAAHTRPPEFRTNAEYLEQIAKHLLPSVKAHGLAERVDIFVDEHAFTVEEARTYLQAAVKLGFSVVVHADQFTRGGALLAAELRAVSADHLEVSQPVDAQALARQGVSPVVLPGATLGLGLPFPPARMLLDQGGALAIASDWNPGSAPMGDLLTQAALLGAYEKLTLAETLAALTSRAARALSLRDRGVLKVGCWADFIVFDCSDYREILYHQGAMRPGAVYKRGKNVWPQQKSAGH